MKMYILIKDTVSTGFAILAAAHSSLACYLKFRDTPDIATWLAGPFYKVICRVNEGLSLTRPKHLKIMLF